MGSGDMSDSVKEMQKTTSISKQFFANNSTSLFLEKCSPFLRAGGERKRVHVLAQIVSTAADISTQLWS